MALYDLKYSDNQKTVEQEYELFVETIQRAVIVEYDREYGNADISFHYIKGAVIVEYDREYGNANICWTSLCTGEG